MFVLNLSNTTLTTFFTIRYKNCTKHTDIILLKKRGSFLSFTAQRLTLFSFKLTQGTVVAKTDPLYRQTVRKRGTRKLYAWPKRRQYQSLGNGCWDSNKRARRGLDAVLVYARTFFFQSCRQQELVSPRCRRGSISVGFLEQVHSTWQERNVLHRFKKNKKTIYSHLLIGSPTLRSQGCKWRQRRTRLATTRFEGF